MLAYSSNNLTINVLYFAQLRELAGARTEKFTLSNPANVADLFSKVTESHPEILQLCSVIQTSLNRKMAKKNAVLSDGDEVAFMPPVTGG